MNSNKTDCIEYVTREILRPEHPDGEKYQFVCCFNDDVWRTESGRSICRNCGHDWTDEIQK